jgi:hypothetical protein
MYIFLLFILLDMILLGVVSGLDLLYRVEVRWVFDGSLGNT